MTDDERTAFAYSTVAQIRRMLPPGSAVVLAIATPKDDVSVSLAWAAASTADDYDLACFAAHELHDYVLAHPPEPASPAVGKGAPS